MIFKKNKQTICCSKRDTRNRSIQSNYIVINGGRSKSRRANDSSNSELSIENLEMDKRLNRDREDGGQSDNGNQSSRREETGRKGTGRSQHRKN